MNHPSAQEQLTILQNADGQRRWRSLEDQRLCVLCRRVITGREIRITSNDTGGHDLRCPTEDCAAAPSDWYYFGSAQAPIRPDAQTAPQRVEMDLDLF
ncbi:MAG: hypothetical protein ABI787_00480 [Spartobacteria bacterium]